MRLPVRTVPWFAFLLAALVSCGPESSPSGSLPTEDPPSLELSEVFQATSVPAAVKVVYRVRQGSRPLEEQGAYFVSDGREGTFPITEGEFVTLELEGFVAGEYEITLRVRDREGGESTASMDFDVRLTLGELDLNVVWIARSSPRIPFRQTYEESDSADGWPVPGQEVTWSARAMNWTDAPVTGVSYRWLLDGEEVGVGTVDIPAESGVDVDLILPWESRRRRLTFQLDVSDAFAEQEEGNNEVSIFTDALSVGLQVEEGLYRYFRETQREFGRGTNSFEDWLQYQIRRWNELLASAVKPELAPDGVRDRFRLDYVRVREDGTLEGSNWHYGDPTVDFRWIFPTGDIGGAPVQFIKLGDPSFRFDPAGTVGDIYLHELLHRRYLIDVYTFDVHHAPNQSLPINRIRITEGGVPVPGSSFMPFLGPGSTAVYTYPDDGIMHRDFSRMTLFSVLALNRVAGRRTVWFPEGTYIGRFLKDLPSENRLVVEDEVDGPLPGARVDVYFDMDFQPAGGDYDDVPDLTRFADEDGAVLIGRNPFGPVMDEPDAHKAIVSIVRVEHEGRVGYGFLPIADFNIEYWRGHTELGQHTLVVKLR